MDLNASYRTSQDEKISTLQNSPNLQFVASDDHCDAHRNDENTDDDDLVFDDEELELLAQLNIEYDEPRIDVPQEAPLEDIAYAPALDDTTIETHFADDTSVEEISYAPTLDDTTKTHSSPDRLACIKYVNSRYAVGVGKKTRTAYKKNWKNYDSPDTVICDRCGGGRSCLISDLNGEMLQRMVTVKDTTRYDKILETTSKSGADTFTCVKYVKTRYHAGPLRTTGERARYLKNWRSRGSFDSIICRACGRGQACNLSDLNRAMMQRTVTAEDTTRLERIMQIGGSYYVDRRDHKRRWNNRIDPYAVL
ncbi:hypothetical protein CYMTET_37419 [Cymbomonas tetramitiformis]|uniref:Uncharacterized protein n=1 Tax=Cymbomonas tetramitiformis TaxID=36881 RepID=A0AAE0F7L2_9CHLO|nr:hypothetical protein CYMTET_37419 [Cymbomonas tetramitiformis]